MALHACNECILHFRLLPNVLLTHDPFICDYHTDYTGRPSEIVRLYTEWAQAGDAAVNSLKQA